MPTLSRRSTMVPNMWCPQMFGKSLAIIAHTTHEEGANNQRCHLVLESRSPQLG
ncbi:unnamed protein product [Ectocarpus sp. CCAP 1310/34]|nr:unnamed protein product [Ectocarpus sp. CCAP 1310/34]